MKFIIKSGQTLLAELNAHFAANPELYARFGLPGNGIITELPAEVTDSRFNDIFLEMYAGKLVLLEGEIQAREQEFRTRYAAVDGNSGLYDSLNFPWLSFSDTALQDTDPATFILGVIHRYDVANSRWWLSAERFTFPGYSAPGSYPIHSTNTLFDLASDGDVSPYTGGLTPGGGGKLSDPAYLSNVLFDGAAVNPNSCVDRVCFAWEEFSQLFGDNKANIPNADDALFSINFCSISSNYSAEVPGSSLMAYPHCVAMYMSYDGQPLLTDGAVVAGAIFRNHAADLGTLMPPDRNIYKWPAGLIPA